MTGFILRTADNVEIRFDYNVASAPITVAAFDKLLPFTRVFIHARISGQEIWTDQAPELDIIQENASVFVEPGEVVYGPSKPARTKTANCMGIYYGEGRGLDCCNIFATVRKEDRELLANLGEKIWKHGEMNVSFDKCI